MGQEIRHLWDWPRSPDRTVSSGRMPKAGWRGVGRAITRPSIGLSRLGERNQCDLGTYKPSAKRKSPQSQSERRSRPIDARVNCKRPSPRQIQKLDKIRGDRLNENVEVTGSRWSRSSARTRRRLVRSPCSCTKEPREALRETKQRVLSSVGEPSDQGDETVP